MGIFDFFKSAPKYDRNKAIMSAIKGKQAYDSRNFSTAAQYFNEYFEYKGFGNFQDLDITDFRMYLNLMISYFYSKQYSKCIEICEKLMRLDATASDSYAFAGMCYYKLGNYKIANDLWAKAKSRNNQIATMFNSIEDVKMQGFSY